MEKVKFDVGDVARLSSGGPHMTVEAAESGTVVCIFFGNGEFVCRPFAQACLEKIFPLESVADLPIGSAIGKTLGEAAARRWEQLLVETLARFKANQQLRAAVDAARTILANIDANNMRVGDVGRAFQLLDQALEADAEGGK